jgi:hypothetical protein
VIRGEIGAGYLRQDYQAPALDKTTGLAVHASIEWYPDELVTVHAGATREISDPGVGNAVSYVGNSVQAGVVYEFRRNVVLGAQVDYSYDEYEGIQRDDDRFQVQAQLDFAVDRVVSLYDNASHFEQRSSGTSAGRDFQDNRLQVGIRFRR